MKFAHHLAQLSRPPRTKIEDRHAFTLAGQTAANAKPISVIWTSPYGPTGKGGMDRITHLVANQVEERAAGSIEFVCLTTKGNFGKALGAFVFAFALARFALLAAMGRADVLHLNVAAYGSSYRKMIFGRVARLLRVPYIVHIHSGRFPQFWKGAPPAISSAVDSFLDHSAAIIVLGREFEALVLERVPTAKGRVTLLYNATPSRRGSVHQPAPNGKLRLSTLGLLGHNKNTTQLIEALGCLAHRSDWIATIAGHGEVERARAQVNELGLNDRISVPGWLDQPAVQRLLEASDIFLLPSLSEGVPMAILEAFSYGVPVIASSVNAIPEIVNDGRNGLLVPVSDLEALVRAITRLLDDTDLRLALGQQALRDHAANYELDAYFDRLQLLWRQVASAVTG